MLPNTTIVMARQHPIVTGNSGLQKKRTKLGFGAGAGSGGIDLLSGL
jgi:hypothetical protein